MAANGVEGRFPDLPRMPSLPHLRPSNATPDQIFAEVEAILRSTRQAVHQIECCSRPGEQLAHIRLSVIDMRRATFVLQKLRSRVDGFAEWYEGVQTRLREDPLMRYFHVLRTEIEHEGLPGAVAELYRPDTGEPIADVACYEDRHGLMVSGATRSGIDLPAGDLAIPHGLRNFRLPDPPTSHAGRDLTEFRFATLADLALDFLEDQVVGPARARFFASR